MMPKNPKGAKWRAEGFCVINSICPPHNGSVLNVTYVDAKNIIKRHDSQDADWHPWDIVTRRPSIER